MVSITVLAVSCMLAAFVGGALGFFFACLFRVGRDDR